MLESIAKLSNAIPVWCGWALVGVVGCVAVGLATALIVKIWGL